MSDLLYGEAVHTNMYIERICVVELAMNERFQLNYCKYGIADLPITIAITAQYKSGYSVLSRTSYGVLHS